ncbi:MAG: CHC2 zinc finger domain-containing protein [Bacteroidales bacterium]|nr:CHC2 zinc finger domain-containing protein [Bacteroidales bacterium]
MFIEQDTINKILDACHLADVISDFVPLTKHGKDLEGECPMCHKKDGLKVSPNKQLSGQPRPGVYKCFSCDFGGSSPINFLMESRKMSFPEACKYLSDKTGVIIPTELHDVPKQKDPDKKVRGTSFKNLQLEASGLTNKDVKAIEVFEDKQVEIDVFKSGTVNQYGQLADGDDMIIHYLDLDGHRLQYKVKDDDKQLKPFYRIRWQFPEAHPLKDGSIGKYKTPFGAGVQLYIPETIRRIYSGYHKTKRLFFTEGEKKAEKLCKHGAPAFGLPGINSLIGKDKSFPESIVRFIDRCQVKEVFFVLDADFRDLSKNLTPDKDVSQRSANFYYAVNNFRRWFQTLSNRQLYVDVYLIAGLGDEKGIDDLLAGSLAGNEQAFLEEVEFQLNAVAEKKAENFKHFELHNISISSMSDIKLRELWWLNDLKEFCTHHFAELSKMVEFKYRTQKWKFDDKDQLVLAQPLFETEIFWEVIPEKGKESEHYRFDYVNMINFFTNRGFFRSKDKSNTVFWIKIENNIITKCDSYALRDFALDLARVICKKAILNFLLRGWVQYFGPSYLSLLPLYQPVLLEPSKTHDYMFFKNNFWKISADGIVEKDYCHLTENIYAEKIKDYDVKRTDRLVNIKRNTRGDDRRVVFTANMTETGCKCDFMSFLYFTSFFSWQKYFDENRRRNEVPFDSFDLEEADLNFVSKMTAIGYLLHRYRDKSCEKAIVGMDAKISDVGDSNGRSGKSLLGKALEYVINQTYIQGKSFAKDNYTWEEVTEKTENIFIDDVRIGFDFEAIFTLITGYLAVEPKGKPKFTLKDQEVPKLYLSTNHSFNKSDGSTADRQFKIAFSDFFDNDFKPRMLFGKNFFNDWEQAEWSLFFNFMAECLELYFTAQKEGWGINGSGLIYAPCDKLERRQLRQEIGDTFFYWLNDYLGITEETAEENDNHLNEKLIRNDLSDNFFQKNPIQRKYIDSPQKFWNRIVKYCKYYGFKLNPTVPTDDNNRPGHIKTAGIEYLIIANSRYEDIPFTTTTTKDTQPDDLFNKA